MVKIHLELGDRDLALERVKKMERLLEGSHLGQGHSGYRQREAFDPKVYLLEIRAILLEDEGRSRKAESLRREILKQRRFDIKAFRDRKDSGKRSSTTLKKVEHHLRLAEKYLALNLLYQQKLLAAETVMRRQFYRTLKISGLYSSDMVATLNRLSRILYEQGRYKESRELSSQALAISQRIGMAPESTRVISAREKHAQALAMLGRYPEAVAEYDRVRQTRMQDPLQRELASRGNNTWALALMRTGRAGEALAMMDRLLVYRRARYSERTYKVAETMAFRAMALAASGDAPAARRAFAEALQRLLTSHDTTRKRNHGPGRQHRFELILEAYLDLLVSPSGQRATRDQGIDPVVEGFRVADLAHARSVHRALSASAARAAAREPALADLVRREQEMARTIDLHYRRLVGFLNLPQDNRPSGIVKQLRREVRKLEKDRRKLYATIVERFPAYANLINPTPVTLKQAQAALGDHEALLTYYVGRQVTYVWAASRSGEAAFSVSPLGREQIARRVAQLRRGVDTEVANVLDLPAFDLVTAHGLYRDLLQPVAAAWNGKRVLHVIPHGSLDQIPFVFLPTRATVLGHDRHPPFGAYRRVPWLVRDLAVSQLPSVNTLVTLRSLPPGDSKRRAFAGFGDPLFNREQLAEVQATSARPQQLAVRRLERRNLRVQPPAPTGGSAGGQPPASILLSTVRIPRLPDTAAEVREIASVLGANDTEDVFLRLRATEANVRKADLANRRIIMFATHGLIPGELDGLRQPALAMTSPALTGDPDDGLLKLNEVLKLRLNADWVVLSACNTASGDGRGAEAISGLGRAFFYAGTRALLVTHWSVETRSARRLTTDLFRRIAARPDLNRAEALRAAMLEVLDGPGFVDPLSRREVYTYAHPIFWAAFALVGDSGR